MSFIKTKTTKVQHESLLQRACVNWFRLQYPKYLIYAIPNGGSRNTIEAARLKREGVLKGVPDLHIPVASNGYHGLYIELKYGKNTPTISQDEIMNKLRKEGYKCVVVWTADEFIDEIKKYLNK